MHALNKIKIHLTDQINKALKGAKVKIEDILYPPNEELGDLSLPLFKLSQDLSMPPNEVGSLVINNKLCDNIISNIKVAGPYLNFFINREFLIKEVLNEIKKSRAKYGQQEVDKKEKIILEFSSVNTHKEYHVGHLRNICFGDCVTKILNACGHDALPISYVNDFGIHVAKTIWNFNKFTQGKNIGLMTDDEKGYLLGQIYADASQKEKEDETAKQMISGFMKKIEERKGDEYDLWKKTRGWSIKHFDKIYKELGIKFKDILYESDNISRGREIVDELVEKGILKMDNGAIIADLKEYSLDVLVCVRSNNTATYAVGDLGLAETKTEKFSPEKSIYIVDVRQELYLKQLFKILELAGHKENLVHLSYDFVKLPSGMMSSRTGNIISYNELKKMLIERASEEIKKRHEGWSKEKVEETARVIGFGAIKFEMLKVDAKSTITFDIDRALSFDGFTSSYIQYAYARIAGIFERNGDKDIIFKKVDPNLLKEKSEIELIKKLSRYPESLSRASREYNPSEIAKYAYELAGLLNDYYHQVSIVNSEDKVKESRLSLLAAIAQTLKNSLNLLGIKIIEEM